MKKEILFSIVIGGAESLLKMQRYHDQVVISDMVDFVDDIMRKYINSCKMVGLFPREFFDAALAWSRRLFDLRYYGQSINYCEEAIEFGIRNYPDLYPSCLLLKANVLSSIGQVELSKRTLFDLAQKPYLFSSRNITPDIIFDLARNMLVTGDTVIYLRLLFYGLSLFYTDINKRRRFVDQITSTHTKILNVLISRHVDIKGKLLYSFHRIAFALYDSWIAGKIHATKLIR